MDYNYQKAYCTQSVPAFKALPAHVRKAHAALLPLVGDLQQNRSLAIPLNDNIIAILEPLTTLEIAEMSRASYYVGHHHPSLLPRLFDNPKGESWKITNCCDQVLRVRIKPPHNVLIHDGKLRVTFSSRDCWLWEEFALATEENLKTFLRCKLPFGESTLQKSAEQVAAVIGDMWGDPNQEKDNALYKKYLKLKQNQQESTIKANFAKKIEDLKKDQVAAQKEIDFLLMCNKVNISIDNVIYYKHTDIFCFGWRDPLSEDSKKAIWRKLGPMRQAGNAFNVDFK